MTTGKTIEGKYVLSNIKAWDNAVFRGEQAEQWELYIYCEIRENLSLAAIFFFNSHSRKIALEIQGAGGERMSSELGDQMLRSAFPNWQHLEILSRAQIVAPPTVRNPLHSAPPRPQP